ncbi:MFS transporter [Fructilactobacillus florum]|uniref:MFS transporter n=1 Tax=Fructilactobacillus florum TaxID=640331 RepID=UPI00028D9798|nr:MFS transporter [Fructilactobacillus florum]EKK20495.1 Permease of the major facilitator superfamily [Fructilactobacillus florum 2F]
MKVERKNWQTGLAILIIMAAVLIMLSLQLATGDVIIGYDTFFHFNRIYDTAMQFQTHHFNYFMSNFGYRQSGQIVNALYGPYMAYLLGFLLFLTKSWFWFEITTAFGILTIAGLGAYGLFRKLRINQGLAVAGAIIYLSQNFITYWITSSAFLDWGAMLLPFALMVAIDLLAGSAAKVHFTLAIVVGLLLETHVLSAVITVLMFLPFFIVGWIRSLTKWAYFKKVAANVILACLLSANYFAAFYNVFINNRLIPPFRVTNLADGAVQFSTTNLTQSGLGIVLMVIISLQGLFIIFNFKRSRLNLMLTTVGFLFYLISSTLFPWNQIGKILPDFQDFLQFPSRFLAFAGLLLLTGFLLSLNQFIANWSQSLLKNSSYALVGLLAVMALMLGVKNIKIQLDNNWQMTAHAPQVGVYGAHLFPNGFYQSGISNQRLKQDFHAANLVTPLNDVIRATTDYLPNTTKQATVSGLQDQYRKQITDNNRNYHKQVLANGSMQLTWKNNQAARVVQIPMVAYRDTQVRLNGKELHETNTDEHLSPDQYRRSDIGAIQVRAATGKNRMVVSYQAPWYFTGALFVSLLAWILTLGLELLRKIRKNRLV